MTEEEMIERIKSLEEDVMFLRQEVQDEYELRQKAEECSKGYREAIVKLVGNLSTKFNDAILRSLDEVF